MNFQSLLKKRLGFLPLLVRTFSPNFFRLRPIPKGSFEVNVTYSVITGAVEGRGEGVPEDPPGNPDPVATEVLRDTPDTENHVGH